MVKTWKLEATTSIKVTYLMFSAEHKFEHHMFKILEVGVIQFMAALWAWCRWRSTLLQIILLVTIHKLFWVWHMRRQWLTHYLSSSTRSRKMGRNWWWWQRKVFSPTCHITICSVFIVHTLIIGQGLNLQLPLKSLLQIC